jgi:hypothetical protein
MSASAINHLVNPVHPNKPTWTMMKLLNRIMAQERPDLVKPQDCEKKEALTAVKPGPTHFSPVEKKIIEGVRELPAAEQEMVLSVVNTLVQIRNRNFRKTRQ